MKNLNRLQYYGLAAFLGGMAIYLILALSLPAFRWAWLAAWGIAALGAIVYAAATLPFVVKWLRSIGINVK